MRDIDENWEGKRMPLCQGEGYLCLGSSLIYKLFTLGLINVI